MIKTIKAGDWTFAACHWSGISFNRNPQTGAFNCREEIESYLSGMYRNWIGGVDEIISKT